jgi:hypothetical protein
MPLGQSSTGGGCRVPKTVFCSLAWVPALMVPPHPAGVRPNPAKGSATMTVLEQLLPLPPHLLDSRCNLKLGYGYDHQAHCPVWQRLGPLAVVQSDRR